MAKEEDEEIKRTFKKSLPVELTEAEAAKKGNKVGKLKQKIAKQREEAKAKTAAEREEIKKLQAQLDSILDDLARNKEDREVECDEIFNYRAKKVIVVRKDTNDTVESREMLATELQQALEPKKGKN